MWCLTYVCYPSRGVSRMLKKSAGAKTVSREAYLKKTVVRLSYLVVRKH